MFEGKDYPTQWALNPSAYQNMSNDQVDWAALAQQWIKMKETAVPPAPPPPTIQSARSPDHGGEAPMDVDGKDDDIPPAPPAPNISGSDGWNQWSQWGHWNATGPGTGTWEWSGVPPPGVTMGPDGRPTGIPNSAPPTPNISPSFAVPPPAAPSYGYNSVAPAQSYNQVSNYWSGDSGLVPPPPPPAFAKGMRHSRLQPRGNEPRGREEREKSPEEDSASNIDAAKRRQLPAWIREGLEKMEREKQKAVERERQEMLRKQELEARKRAEEEARAVMDPSKSKFDKDSDSEKETEPEAEAEAEPEEKYRDRSPEVVVRARKSRFRDADSPEAKEESSPAAGSFATKRSRDEILQDVMLKVRRSLTEILLEVTNEEVAAVCREVWSRARAKGSQSRAYRRQMSLAGGEWGAGGVAAAHWPLPRAPLIGSS